MSSRNLYFNPRSRMGSDLPSCLKNIILFNFNPRSRMGSDPSSKPLVIAKGISIHAPAWGATEDTCSAVPRGKISIHAPAWGATFVRPSSFRSFIFQSTLPHGERRHSAPLGTKAYQFQSTLPHGERPKTIDSSGSNGNFNPRSRMGSDCAMKMIPFHRIWEVLFREPCFTGCCHLTEF